MIITTKNVLHNHKVFKNFEVMRVIKDGEEKSLKLAKYILSY